METEAAIAVAISLLMAPVGALVLVLYVIASIVDMVQRATHSAGSDHG